MQRLPGSVSKPLAALALFLTSSTKVWAQVVYGPDVASVPVDNPWALALIALLIMAVGFWSIRRSGVRADRFLTLALPVLAGALLVGMLAGPQVTRALMNVVEMNNPRGGEVGIVEGTADYKNTSGVRQRILEIRNLPPCIFAVDVLEPAGLIEPQYMPPPECEVGLRVQPGNACGITARELDDNNNYSNNDFKNNWVAPLAQNGKPLCRLPPPQSKF